MKIQKICAVSLFTAAALIVFVIEAQLPPLSFCPMFKPGLANVVTLFILFAGGGCKVRDSAIVLALRIILGALITGAMMTVLFSAVGGVFAMAFMCLGKRLFKGRFIPTVSIMGAFGHNIGQMLTAVIVYGSLSVVWYLPIMLIGGILSGALTGFCVCLIRKNRPFMNMIRNIK